MPIDVSHMKKCIAENLKDIHRVVDVARMLNVSPETLRKEFLRRERIALSQYVTSMRVKCAKELLLNSHLRCFEICYEVGFFREDSGGKTFKRFTGMTMEQYRKNEKNSRHKNRNKPFDRMP